MESRGSNITSAATYDDYCTRLEGRQYEHSMGTVWAQYGHSMGTVWAWWNTAFLHSCMFSKPHGIPFVVLKVRFFVLCGVHHAHTVPILCPYCAHTVPILCPYCAHSVLHPVSAQDCSRWPKVARDGVRQPWGPTCFRFMFVDLDA